MSEKGNTYSYYNYTNKYSSRFLNQYQSQSHWWGGRASGYLEILRLKAVRMRSHRNWMWFDIRYGWKFLYIIYMPQFIFVAILYILTPAWRRMDERYHLRFSSDEGDTNDEVEPFVNYQMRKKPVTRRKYSDAIKVVYNGVEEWDYISEQPIRYR